MLEKFYHGGTENTEKEECGVGRLEKWKIGMLEDWKNFTTEARRALRKVS